MHNDKLRLIKRSLALQLFGGVRRKTSDDNYLRGDIHILLMGDPGVAKSQLLSYMSNISPRGKFATGGGTTGAGLTAAAIRDTFGDGRFALEAGVLPFQTEALRQLTSSIRYPTKTKEACTLLWNNREFMSQRRDNCDTSGEVRNTSSEEIRKGGRFSNRNENSSIMTSFEETGYLIP